MNEKKLREKVIDRLLAEAEQALADSGAFDGGWESLLLAAQMLQAADALRSAQMRVSSD